MAGSARSLVAEAICKISEAFSKSPTEDAMVQAVQDNLTGDSDADELIYGYARDTLLLLRTRRKQ
jgi:hypothetical protein